MNRPLLIGFLAGAAAWILFRNNNFANRTIVPVDEAAAKLRHAWADHRTTA